MSYTTRADARARRDERRERPVSDGGISDHGDVAERSPAARATLPVRKAVGPLAGAGALETTAAVIHLAVHGWLVTGVACIAGSVICIGIGAGMAHARSARTEQSYLRFASAASVWLWLGVIAAPHLHGWILAPVQVAPFAGAVAAAAPGWVHARRQRRYQAPPTVPLPAIEPPAEPAEVASFRDTLCRAGKFGGAVLTGFRRLGDAGELGWTLKVFIPPTAVGTVSDMMSGQTRMTIAKLFHTNLGNVHVEFDPEFDPLNPSEAHAQVTIGRKRPRTADTVRRIDPRVSTFDLSTGAFEVADYADGAPGRWQMFQPPRGGAKGGIISGRPGFGKTGAAHVIISQAGLATQNRRRLCVILTADPQRMPFSVWKGRATAAAVGPLATLHALRMTAAITYSRAELAGSRKWTDARGRDWDGAGWWDVSPDFPLVGLWLDELPIITGPEFGDNAREARALISLIVREARKTGVFIVPLTQTPDLHMVGGREIREVLTGWNVLAFSGDVSSTGMIGITADPALLDQVGMAYLSGIDRRPGTPVTTRWLEEDTSHRFEEGGDHDPDVREVADLIASMPVHLDDGFLRAAEDFGYPGGNWVITDDDVPAEPEPEDFTPAGLQVVGSDTAGALAPVQAVLDVLMDLPAAALYDLVRETGQSVAAVTSATAILAQSGQITDAGNGRWAIRSPAA